MSTVFLHGFTADRQSWARLDWPQAITPTLPGHAGRPIPEVYSLWDAARDLADELPPLFDLVGYSLGGRVALHLALAYPQRVRRLVLIGAAPAIPDPTARIAEDERWAAILEHKGLDAFYEAWNARPLFASRAGLKRALPTHDPQALAQALRAFSPGRQDDLRPRLHEIVAPTLWLAGEADTKFSAIARESAPACRRGQAAIVPGCGHDIPTERPDALKRQLIEFFSATAPVLGEAL